MRPAPRPLLRLVPGPDGEPGFAPVGEPLRRELASWLTAEWHAWLREEPGAVPPGVRATIAAALATPVVVCLSGEAADDAVRRAWGDAPPPVVAVLPDNSRNDATTTSRTAPGGFRAFGNRRPWLTNPHHRAASRT